MAAGPENPADDSVEKADGEHQQEQIGESTEPAENQGGDDDDENADEDQQNFGADGMNGGFQNMNFQGSDEYNQMQMMMAMQNGMGANNSFGGFPMMGMWHNPGDDISPQRG